jgi:hypothetical protein
MAEVKPVAPRKHKSNTKTTLVIGTALPSGQQCRLRAAHAKKNCPHLQGGVVILGTAGGYLGTGAI